MPFLRFMTVPAKRGAAAHGSSQLRSGTLLLAALACTWSRTAGAVDAFEIQVYDGSANASGVPGLELHANSVAAGQKSAEPPELPANHQSHFTLEPSLGLTGWWEVGGYFQSALTGDGRFRYAGVKLRSKFVTPEGWNAHFRLGMNWELSRVPQAFERGRWGGEVRPIAAFDSARFSLVVNPIVELSLAGPDAQAGPSFAPAAMAKVKVLECAALGLEYYADLGAFSDFAPLREQQHYVYEAFDLLGLRDWELNAGLGEGLTSASNALVLKVIVGYSWGAARLWGH